MVKLFFKINLTSDLFKTWWTNFQYDKPFSFKLYYFWLYLQTRTPEAYCTTITSAAFSRTTSGNIPGGYLDFIHNDYDCVD